MVLRILPLFLELEWMLANLAYSESRLWCGDEHGAIRHFGVQQG